MTGDGDVWSSLEVAKLVVSALIPITVAALTLVVTRVAREGETRARDAELRAARRAEAAEWANRRVVELLIQVHEQMAPALNDLYCFMRHRGHFRSIPPPAALQRKRDCDRIFHVNQHLFDEEFAARYTAFIEACFAHFGDPGEDARIRSSRSGLQHERGAAAGWDASWDELFTAEPEDPAQQKREQEREYRELMASFARQLGLGARA